MGVALDEDYREEVMRTCKKLLDSLHEGQHLDLSSIVDSNKKKIEFVAHIVKFGDTFKSDSTKPIYGLLFTTEGQEEYLLREASEIGLGQKTRAIITIKAVSDKTNGNMAK